MEQLRANWAVFFSLVLSIVVTVLLPSIAVSQLRDKNEAAIVDRENNSTAELNVWSHLELKGKNVKALVIAPTTPSTIYVVAHYTLFKTLDGGESWRTISDGLNVRINALAVDPTSLQTIYAGGTDESMDIGLVFKSTDGGNSWHALDLTFDSALQDSHRFPPVSPPVSVLAIDPATSSTIYAGTSEEGLVLKSVDGGKSWRNVTPDVWSSIGALVIDPEIPSTLYAAAGPDVFKSTDGGKKWREFLLSAAPDPIMALAIDPTNPSILYAARKTVFKSTDGGGNWRDMGLEATFSSFVALAINPKNSSTLYAANDDRGVYESTDRGESWHRLSSEGLKFRKINTLAIDPTTSLKLYAGTDNGVWAIQQTSTPTSE